MREKAIHSAEHLIIVESDVIVQNNTIMQMVSCATEQQVGMVAAVTENDKGEINFPYEYAQNYPLDRINTQKRLSFCCTLMSLNMLMAVDFEQLNPEKQWFDVTISKLSRTKGFSNILMTDTRVKHYPHSSRPWKQLKYTHPLKYYWNKLLHGRDKI